MLNNASSAGSASKQNFAEESLVQFHDSLQVNNKEQNISLTEIQTAAVLLKSVLDLSWLISI